MSGTVLGKGTGGAVGPASRIVWGLFNKRGVTRTEAGRTCMFRNEI
jgi:hypothetical protein